MANVEHESLSGSKIALIVLQTLLYLVGLFIQYKIIFVCWKDKEGKTWQIHLTQSISTIIYFAFNIPFWNLASNIPGLGSYTGEWFCYMAVFLNFYGFYIITFNSLLVAIMKYTFIVHYQKVLAFGEDRAKKLFLTINVGLPFTFAVVNCLTKDIEGYADILSCFGLTDHARKKYNTWEKKMQKFFMCNIDWSENDISEKYALYVVQQCICGIKSVVGIVVNTNFPEAFLYYKIFSKMKRQVTPTENNRAANCLSEEIQKRNMRKVKVNAQVTFVIYILESVANFSIFVFWFFIFQKNNDLSLVLGIFWFHIFLPYTFLQNTSHNKNLVLDEGWGNTIRNTIGLPENFNFFSVVNIRQYIPRWNHDIITNIDDSCGMKSQNPAQDIELENVHSKQDVIDEVPTISKSVEMTSLTEGENTINVPENKASSSTNRITDSKDQVAWDKLDRSLIRIPSDSDDDYEFLQRSDRLIMGEDILSYMAKYLNDECGYLHYLKELSKFNECFSKNINAADDFQILHMTNFTATKVNRIKGSMKNKAKHPRISQDNGSKDQSKSKSSTMDQESENKSKNSGAFTDKIRIRKKLLESYQEYCCDEESFNNLVGVIFDIEETLIEE